MLGAPDYFGELYRDFLRLSRLCLDSDVVAYGRRQLSHPHCSSQRKEGHQGESAVSGENQASPEMSGRGENMTAVRTGRKQPSIRTLWAIAKSPELHMTDEDLHAVVYRETGKESMRKLTQGEINTVARVLQNMKDSASRSRHAKRTDEGGNTGTVELRRKIYMLMQELGWSPAQVDGLAKRMFRVERQEWLDRRQCVKLAEALKAMLKRKEERDGTA